MVLFTTASCRRNVPDLISKDFPTWPTKALGNADTTVCGTKDPVAVGTVPLHSLRAAGEGKSLTVKFHSGGAQHAPFIFDAFEILKRIEEEREALNDSGGNAKVDTKQGFAERRSK